MTGSFNKLTAGKGATVIASHIADQASHLVLTSSGRRYRLTIPTGASDTDPLTYMLPADTFWELRKTAMSAFHEHIHLGRLRHRPVSLDPGPSERWRLVQWLRLLDALHEGVSLAAAMVSTAIVAVPAHAQFGGIVYDPSNYAQNVMTAARSLQQINNQIQQIQNQATSLINEARNLTSLPISTIETLQSQVDQTRQLLNQAQRIAYEVTDVQQVFNGRYKGSALSAGQAQMVANARDFSTEGAVSHE